jgi:hypothetical protein
MKSEEDIKELEKKLIKIQKKRLLDIRDSEGQLLNLRNIRPLNAEEERKLSEAQRNIHACETELQRLGVDLATITFEDVI